MRAETNSHLSRSSNRMTGARHLFVYGTLRPAADCAMGRSARDRLSREAVHVGGATMRGRLLDLGRYPALVAIDLGGVVRGDVLELASPGLTWPWLDAYEGPGYLRVVGQSHSDDGRRFAAWVYICKVAPAGAGQVPGGDWLTR